VLSFEKLK